MLIRAEKLAQHLNDPDWVIFDCRHDLVDHGKGEKLFRESHLPGAQFVPVETALAGIKNGANGRHPLPAPNVFADFLALHGVTPATTIVTYDDAGGLYAARLWWMCRWIGLTHVSLLDGGWNKWVAEGRAVTSEVVARAPAPAFKVEANSSQLRSVAEVLRTLSDPAFGVVDARAGERYRGEVEPMDPVAGHIPGALNRFYKTNLQPDLTFRPAKELQQEFRALIGPREPGRIAHSCGSGITACANIFAMEYAGLPGSKLYAGSWSEWVSDPTRPVARGSS